MFVASTLFILIFLQNETKKNPNNSQQLFECEHSKGNDSVMCKFITYHQSVHNRVCVSVIFFST